MARLWLFHLYRIEKIVILHLYERYAQKESVIRGGFLGSFQPDYQQIDKHWLSKCGSRSESHYMFLSRSLESSLSPSLPHSLALSLCVSLSLPLCLPLRTVRLATVILLTIPPPPPPVCTRGMYNWCCNQECCKVSINTEYSLKNH